MTGGQGIQAEGTAGAKAQRRGDHAGAQPGEPGEHGQHGGDEVEALGRTDPSRRYLRSQKKAFTLCVMASYLIASLIFTSDSVVKNLPANAGEAGSIPGLRSPGEGNGNQLRYSYLGNPLNRGYKPWGCRARQDLTTKQQLTDLPPADCTLYEMKDFASGTYWLIYKHLLNE